MEAGAGLPRYIFLYICISRFFYRNIQRCMEYAEIDGKIDAEIDAVGHSHTLIEVSQQVHACNYSVLLSTYYYKYIQRPLPYRTIFTMHCMHNKLHTVNHPPL